MNAARPDRILLVTGMSGAGKSTALKTLEDLGWEAIDNLPFALLARLLDTTNTDPDQEGRPLAIGIDSRTRGFDAQSIIERVGTMRAASGENIAIVFLDCAGAELERRFSETRRRHPLAPDRAVADGIARERELIAPLRRHADHVIDTTASNSNDLRTELRNRFESTGDSDPALTILSFGFARGLPRNADLVFDMRFLSNPHWDDALRPLTGRDEAVAAHIRADPAYGEALSRLTDLLLFLLPRYRAEGKAYVTVAFGCTGGRHRSVHLAEIVANRLREEGFSPTIVHRDLGQPADDTFDAVPGLGQEKTGLQARN